MTDEGTTAAEAAEKLVEQAREAHSDQVPSRDTIPHNGLFSKGPDGITRRVSDKLLVMPPKPLLVAGDKRVHPGEHLSLRGHQILTVATSNLAAGDYEAALEGMSELKEEDVDPMLSVLSTLMQIAMAVGTNHQLVALAARDKERAESAS